MSASIASMCTTTTRKKMEDLVQYVIVRTDLKKTLNYNTGAIVGNSCHASVAVIGLNSTNDFKNFSC